MKYYYAQDKITDLYWDGSAIAGAYCTLTEKEDAWIMSEQDRKEIIESDPDFEEQFKFIEK